MSESGSAPTPNAVVIDAGVGNLGNLARALRHLGAGVEVTDRPEPVAAGRCLLLPGVGAFRPPRERIRGALEEALREALAQGAWLLGICVGYQLLFEGSDEFGETDGLGLLAGRIARLPATVSLPHIGWNALHDLAPNPLLAGVEEGSYAYFVHSYAPEGVPGDAILARATHGRPFAAVGGSGRVLGTQFHPEKSADVGLRLLANYLELAAS
ncbi:MAG TPA: imidazole glycerol phosphate synthase subunit HisH [Thermoanaerobaculia bacterium]|nr:imidazole glycerol phosphate synthase subunit HisH [Thermoanaerobaculia bacterium]